MIDCSIGVPLDLQTNSTNCNWIVIKAELDGLLYRHGAYDKIRHRLRNPKEGFGCESL